MDREPTYKRSLLRQWQENARESKRIREVTQSIMLKMMKGSKQGSFRCWVVFMELLKEQEGEALYFAQLRAYHVIFPCWQRHAEEQRHFKQKVRVCLLKIWRSTKSNLFEAWQEFVTLKKKRREQHARASAHWRAVTADRFLGLWNVGLARWREDAKNFSLAQGMADRFTLQNFWRVWLSFTHYTVTMKKWLEKAEIFRLQNVEAFQHEALVAWKEWTKQRHATAAATATALRMWVNLSVAPALRRWVDFTRTMRRRKEVLVASIGKLDPDFQEDMGDWAGADGYERAVAGAADAAVRHLILI